MRKSDSLFYLLGLICGKGNIIENNKITVEFPHKEKITRGIAYCPKCGWLATSPSDNEGNLLKCKNKDCENSKSFSIDSKVRKEYDQPKLVYESIITQVIPFLKKEIDFDFNILSNNHLTIIKFENLKEELISYVKKLFGNAKSFDEFQIPKELNQEEKKYQIEFINGLLDTTSNANHGNWHIRNGKNGIGRMRIYFQVVRNWKLPIQIDNFLRKNFNISSQTIRWGHPNINDPELKEFLNDKKPFREHQLKIFPEYLKIFKYRISPKKNLFDELLKHNLTTGFDVEEDWLKSKRLIEEKDIKASHPLENDLRIPDELRGKHFDAMWQINLHMGCEYLNKEKKKAKSPKVYELIGDLNETDSEFYEKKIKTISLKKYNAAISLVIEDKKDKNKEKNTKRSLELETYPILIEWLKKYIKEKYKEDSDVFDTSSKTLSRYFTTDNFKSNEVIEKVKKIIEFKNLDIRPDVVGVSKKTSKLFFIESKVVSPGVKEVGQILVYSLVAEPFESFLISTKKISNSLLTIISQKEDFLNFDINKKIKICLLTGNEVVIQ
jgi:hypothetical protein